MPTKKILELIAEYIHQNPSVVIGNFSEKIHHTLDKVKKMENRDPRKHHILRELANDINLPQELNGNCDKLIQNLQALARSTKNLQKIDQLGLVVGDKVIIKNHGSLKRNVSLILLDGYFRVSHFSFNVSPFDILKVLK